MEKEDVIHIHTHIYTMEYYLAIKRRKALHVQQCGWTLRAQLWVKQVRQRKTKTTWSHFYVETPPPHKTQTHKYKEPIGVARGGSWGGSGWHEWRGQMGQTSSYKINSPGAPMYSMVTIVNTTLLHIRKMLREEVLKFLIVSKSICDYAW